MLEFETKPCYPVDSVDKKFDSASSVSLHAGEKMDKFEIMFKGGGEALR